VKALFLAHSYPRFAADPVGSFILRLAVALKAEGVEVLVLAPAAEGCLLEEEYEGVRVRRYHYAPRAWETLAYAGTMAQQVRSGWRAKLALLGLLWAGHRATRRAIREFQPDIIHAHWWFPAGLVAWSATWRSGLPWVVTLHGSDLIVARRSRWGGKLFRAVARRARAMTTVSSWLAEEARALAPTVVPIVAPMPIAGHLFSPGGSREADRLLFVGKLNRQKGFGFLLQALAAMRHRPVVDVVVGVGSERAEVEDQAQSFGVAAQLRWHPLLQQTELARLYRRCTALVMPAVDEGLGLVAAEAMLSAQPVVAFASGGLTDVVLDGRTGYLVPPGDAAVLASALDRLLDLPDQGAAMGLEGLALARDRFGPSAAARRYAELYWTACPVHHGG
jgi:glycosyltransferase involved in cell wall biosynthesis